MATRINEERGLFLVSKAEEKWAAQEVEEMLKKKGEHLFLALSGKRRSREVGGFRFCVWLLGAKVEREERAKI